MLSSICRRNGPTDDAKVGVSESDMDRLKQEIMTDIKKELQKLKLDIIEGRFDSALPILSNPVLFVLAALKVELNRR